MMPLAIKAVLSGLLIALISEIGRKLPTVGALVASLPLVSVIGMVFLWNARPEPENMAIHAEATFWYVLPSLPMFLAIPALLRHGVPFWIALVAGCVLTIVLYLAMMQIAPRFGLKL